MAAKQPGVTVRAPAKVNLCLGVGPVQGDGYHPLATVFHAVDLTDTVTVRPSKRWECTVTGPYADRVPTGASNLAMRVAQRLADECFEAGPVSMTIDKSIPVAGGMAGGSADAAAAIIAIDQLFDLQLTKLDHHELATDIGADVPFILAGGTALGTGRGDQLAPVLTTGRYEWVFALQDDGLSTPAVYAEFDRLNKGRKVPLPQAPEEMIAALRSGDPASSRAPCPTICRRRRSPSCRNCRRRSTPVWQKARSVRSCPAPARPWLSCVPTVRLLST